MAGGLTPKQRRFIEEYMVDSNATQAAIRAGYSAKTASEIGRQNLTKLEIASELQARRAVISAKLQISQEWVLQKLAAIVDTNITDIVNVKTEKADKLGIHPITGEVVLLPTGWQQYVKVIDTTALPEEKRVAVASIKQGRNGIEVKMHDKVRALELLGKATGVFDNIAAQQQNNNLFEAIVESAGEDFDTDGIHELEQEATAGDDVVEPTKI